MHQALRIPEVLRLIIRHFHPFGDESFQNGGASLKHIHVISNDTAKSLARVALVCSSFSEPALDYLWWFIRDLTPLFRLLPAFVPGSNHVEFSDLNGQILAGDLKRFNSYAHRIRCYHMLGVERFHTSTIARILRECDRTYLLPCLQRLIVYNAASAILSFVSPNLRVLNVWVDSSPSCAFQEIASCVTSLPSVTPDLLSISIESDLSAEAVAAIAQLPRLAKLRISGFDLYPVKIDLTTILKMSSVPTLQSLDLAMDVDFESPPLPSSFDGLEPTMFSCLIELKISVGSQTMTTLNSFLALALLPHLQHLCVQVPENTYRWNDTERQHWSKFFCRLPKMTSKSLRKLQVLSVDHNVDSQMMHGLSLDEVSSLDSFDLTTFEITSPLIKSMSLTNIEYVTRCWPNLRILNLYGDINPTLGLHSLIVLAQNLPNLEDLTMKLPSRQPVSISEIPILNHGLRDIDLSHIEAPSPKEFIQAVNRLFPNLRHWFFHGLENSDDEDAWDDASELLSDYQSIQND